MRCWLARHTRGNSYVYWPPIFGRLCRPSSPCRLTLSVTVKEQGVVQILGNVIHGSI